MALVHVHYHSLALDKQCGLFATIPDAAEPPRPVVYLLHGLSDDYSGWQRHTSVERLADELKLCVVMPDGGRSYYLDAQDGSGDWERHILETVAFYERSFRVRSGRTARGIAGLSMGGYGAMKIALRHPGMFASTTPLSGVLDISKWDESPERRAVLARVTGGRPPASEDCFQLISNLQRGRAVIPRMRLVCGTEDGLIVHQRDFHAHLEKLGIDHEYAEHPGGHDWRFWDLHLGAALTFHRQVFDAHVR